jgi:hypothetical protein
MKSASDRKTRLRAVRPGAAGARVPPHDQRTAQPTSSVLSARTKARARLWFCPPATQKREPASGRDRQHGQTWRPCGAVARSGRPAPVEAAHRSAEHHHHRPAGEIARAQSDGKHLAIRARQLALKREQGASSVSRTNATNLKARTQNHARSEWVKRSPLATSL